MHCQNFTTYMTYSRNTKLLFEHNKPIPFLKFMHAGMLGIYLGQVIGLRETLPGIKPQRICARRMSG